jgi:predicted ATPase
VFVPPLKVLERRRDAVKSATRTDPLPGMMKAGRFEPYIRYVRFPYFRNLADGTRIEFGYPVTALVGPNGTNKTAILRALQGCPGSENMGRYWFSTSLDPIGPEDRHRCIHGYYAPSAGSVVEVVKMRTQRAGDPDYWETQRPIQGDGMAPMPKLAPGEPVPEARNQTRWKAVRKDVVYVDFRSSLSAFDRYFYHVPYAKGASTLAEKKDRIRGRSRHLVTAMKGNPSHIWNRNERIIEPARQLDNVQVAAVSEILGRPYDVITVLAHRYFGFDGFSVQLHASGLSYSEAFAGSGEFAVVMLVLAVTEAKDRSLILLDEPEISLHPGAQGKLMAFIRDQAKARCHQFVLSTHSPEIIRDLPDEAIKVFQARPGDGKIELPGQVSSPADAFFRLGVPVSGEHVIFVEDMLAGAVVERAMRLLPESAHARARIEVLPGGADEIQAHMTTFLPPSSVRPPRRCSGVLRGFR